MVKDVLTDAMIEAGAALLRKLDEIGLDVRSALWMYDVEIEEWRLLFAAPEVGIKGPLSAYETIDRALEELGPEATEATAWALQVMDVHADLSRRLKGRRRVDPERKGVRVRRAVFNDKYLDDALIYRAA